MGTGFIEYTPKSECFVPGTRHDWFTIRGHCQIEYTIRVTRQLGNLRQTWIFPNQDLILTVPVSAHLKHTKVNKNIYYTIGMHKLPILTSALTTQGCILASRCRHIASVARLVYSKSGCNDPPYLRRSPKRRDGAVTKR